VRSGNLRYAEGQQWGRSHNRSSENYLNPSYRPDFIATIFQQLRKGRMPPDSKGSRLALDVFSMTEDLIVSAQTLAIRVRRGGS
jgi:hypothetical protein